jgi:hypothetical protein
MENSARRRRITMRIRSIRQSTRAIDVCRNQQSGSAESQDVERLATDESVPLTRAKILVVLPIGSADLLPLAAMVVDMRSGESSSFIAIRSAESDASAMDSHQALSLITSCGSKLAVIGRSRTDKAAASPATTGNDRWSRAAGRGVQFSAARRPADRRAVAHTHPRNKIFRSIH